ncbi:MAG: AAA family ATPase [bacterium]|nr:AAA family ATPase [bacterium]
MDEVEFEHRLPKSKLAIIKKIDAIIIDEISMVRADMMDCIDLTLKKVLDPDLPFGGMKMIFVGDLYQLPPIIRKEEQDYFLDHYDSHFFFSSFAYQDLDPEVIELQSIYRQEDPKFKQILNKIRVGISNQKDLDILNQCIQKEIPEDLTHLELVTTNANAQRINQAKLNEIDAELHHVEAIIQGDVPKSYYANDALISFKA